MPERSGAMRCAYRRPTGFLLRRAHGSGARPRGDQRTRDLLGPGRRLTAEAGCPGPADQRVGADVVDEVVQRTSAVALAILDLRADLTERLALPRHLARRDVPLRVAGHAARLEVGALVADRTTHGNGSKPVRAALDRRLVQSGGIALARRIARRMAVGATRVSQHLAELGEHRHRASRRVADRRKALR